MSVETGITSANLTPPLVPSASDPDKTGFTLSAADQVKWDAPQPEYLKWSKRDKFWVVCKRFPVHWLKHNLMCVPLIVVSFVPVLFSGLQSREMIRAHPNATGVWFLLERA
jgi:hypothetical protein